mmetsp:Transcript_76322/g.205118  ORF Transcript_76322/g.205118 Transcript_76322/m.205118 type:complete len:228 (-) Transcript_76322:3766-4449(-)
MPPCSPRSRRSQRGLLRQQLPISSLPMRLLPRQMRRPRRQKCPPLLKRQRRRSTVPRGKARFLLVRPQRRERNRVHRRCPRREGSWSSPRRRSSGREGWSSHQGRACRFLAALAAESRAFVDIATWIEKATARGALTMWVMGWPVLEGSARPRRDGRRSREQRRSARAPRGAPGATARSAPRTPPRPYAQRPAHTCDRRSHARRARPATGQAAMHRSTPPPPPRSTP